MIRAVFVCMRVLRWALDIARTQLVSRFAMGESRHAPLTSTRLPLHALWAVAPPTIPSSINQLCLNKRIV